MPLSEFRSERGPRFSYCSHWQEGEGIARKEKYMGDAPDRDACATLVATREPMADGVTFSGWRTSGRRCYAEFDLAGANKLVSSSRQWQCCKLLRGKSRPHIPVKLPPKPIMSLDERGCKGVRCKMLGVRTLNGAGPDVGGKHGNALYFSSPNSMVMVLEQPRKLETEWSVSFWFKTTLPGRAGSAPGCAPDGCTINGAAGSCCAAHGTKGGCKSSHTLETAQGAHGCKPPSTSCAREGGVCKCVGNVRYGADGKYKSRLSTASLGCNNGVFGDPTPGILKTCTCIPLGGVSTCCLKTPPPGQDAGPSRPPPATTSCRLSSARLSLLGPRLPSLASKPTLPCRRHRSQVVVQGRVRHTRGDRGEPLGCRACPQHTFKGGSVHAYTRTASHIHTHARTHAHNHNIIAITM